jgi:competence protein ComEC
MRPLVYLVPAFILGLLASRAVEPTYSLVIVLLLISLALLTSATIKGGKVRVILACPAFFALGLLYLLPTITLYDSPSNIRNLIKTDTEKVRLEGVVIGAVEARGDGARFYLDVVGVSVAARWQVAEGRVQITTRARNQVVSGLSRGDTVRLFARLKKPYNFGNPGGFDYQWWLRARGVSMTAYARPGLIIKTRGGEPSLLRSLDLYRARLGVFIDEAGLKHAGILKALAIGYKGDITEAKKEAFRGSGTAHLLAISGLHVGLVAFISYLLLLWLLKRSHRLMLAIDVRRTAVIVSLLPVISYGALSGFL